MAPGENPLLRELYVLARLCDELAFAARIAEGVINVADRGIDMTTLLPASTTHYAKRAGGNVSSGAKTKR